MCKLDVYFYKNFERRINLSDFESGIKESLLMIILQIVMIGPLMLIFGSFDSLYLFLIGWMNVAWIIYRMAKWMKVKKGIIFRNENIEI